MVTSTTSQRVAYLLIGITGLLCLSVFAAATTSALAESAGTMRADLFVIERNKNRNQVQYAIRLDAGCAPVGDAPIEVFWRMLEVSPSATESIGAFEKMAYGIKSQARRGAETELRLEALPEKRLQVRTTKDPSGACVAEAYAPVQGGQARLTRIYVQAEDSALLPSVQHIDVTGVSASGAILTERLAPE